MKYCTSCHQTVELKNVQEVRYGVHLLSQAMEYATLHPDKKIIVEIPRVEAERVPGYMKLNSLLRNCANMFFDFYELQNLIQFYHTWEEDTPIRYMYHFPVVTWAMVQILMYYKVSDITIGEPLTFNLQAVKTSIRDKGVSIRVIPHQAKNALAIPNTDDCGLEHFWILPQHASLYDKYIDVFDLVDNNIKREETLVQVYTSNAPYIFDMGILITNLNCTLPAEYVDPLWVKRRLNCKQKCLEGKHTCHYCRSQYEVYLALQKINQIRDKNP